MARYGRRRKPIGEDMADACAMGAAKGCLSGCSRGCVTAGPQGLWDLVRRGNWRLTRPYARSAVALIRAYQSDISPRLGARCLYEVSCSQYAINAIEQRGLLRGVTRAFVRVCSCNPFYRRLRERPVEQLSA